jgi:hypothetical protein
VIWAAEHWMVYAQGINKTLFDDKAATAHELTTTHELQKPTTVQKPTAAHELQKPTTARLAFEKRVDCTHERCMHRHRYLNAGGIIGYRKGLIRMFEEIESIHVEASGWRNRSQVCPRAKGRQCAEQWAALRVLSYMDWDELNVTLDYESSIFYTADWSIRKCQQQIVARRPTVLHMTFIKAPKVKNTYVALYNNLSMRQPITSASECKRQEANCHAHFLFLKPILKNLNRCQSRTLVVSCKMNNCALNLSRVCGSDIEEERRRLFFETLVRMFTDKRALRHAAQNVIDRPEWLRAYWNLVPYCFYGNAHRIGMNDVWC